MYHDGIWNLAFKFLEGDEVNKLVISCYYGKLKPLFYGSELFRRKFHVNLVRQFV